METLPFYIPLSFTLTLLVTLWLFYSAVSYRRSLLIVVSIWLTLQGTLTLTGFYEVSGGKPPRFILLPLPPVIMITIIFLSEKGRSFLNKIDIAKLTLLHTVRLPVELILYALFVHHAIPRLMTFEGGNLDIFSGLSAPIIWYWGYRKNSLSREWLITWNVICLALLINIVTRALISLPLAKALVHFPYSWLPGFIVPVVLLSHLAAIRQLILNRPRK